MIRLKKCAGFSIFIFSFTFLVFSIQGRNNSSTQEGMLTLEQIFKGNQFTSQRFGPSKWLTFKPGYTTLEASKAIKGAFDIIYTHPEKQQKEVWVSARQLIPEGEKKPLTIQDYSWSSNGSHVLIFTNSKRVWRSNTRGDYWVFNRNKGTLKKCGGQADESSLMFAKFSPDRQWVGYVRGNNLYVENLQNHTIKKLTSDGSKTIINGTFDWVYVEEFGLRDGFRWSPDSKRIAFWQLNCENVGNFYLINNTKGLYSQIIPLQYPKVGTTNSACRLGVVDLVGGQTRWIDLPGESRQHYIARMDWAASSDEIIFQRLNRLQNTIWLYLANVSSGQTKNIFTEKETTWLDVVDDLYWLAKGKYFTWISERSGWRHVYKVSRDGKKIQAITKGPFDVIQVLGIDKAKGWLYFIASPQNPTQRYLYRTAISGKTKPIAITPLNQKGSHQYRLSPDCKWAIHSFSTFEDPPRTHLVSIPKHRLHKILVSNQKLVQKVARIKRSAVEFFKISDEKNNQFDGWCLKPPQFNPQKKYPLLFFVYGEPAGQTVIDRWAGRRTLWHWLLAQKGYIIMSIDNRGTPAPRGRAWRKAIYKKIGIISSQDQAAAARALLKERPYLDPNRIGIWGWSGGGSMSLNMIFRYPDLYKTAMAIAFVSNQRYYDTIYQERYMGLPEQNPLSYKQGSPITYAHQLKGHLLLVHGTGDDNVHYQNCEALVNELIKHNKHFTMMAYPNRSHGIFEGQGTTLHLYTLLTRYLTNNLPSNH